MKRPELYQKTVGILVDAYFDDTLRHGNCEYCAVGNLCYAAGFNRSSDGIFMGLNSCGRWKTVFYTGNGNKSYFKLENYNMNVNGAKEIIDATGYTPHELAKIEKAFELADKGGSKEDYMFNGLMAVVDVLDKIHENTNEETTQQSKNKFKKQVV